MLGDWVRGAPKRLTVSSIQENSRIASEINSIKAKFMKFI